MPLRPIFRTSLLLTLVGSLPLAASGFQLREQSPSAQGSAFAGVSAGGSDLGSMYFNPASMSLYEGTRAAFGFSAVAPTSEFGRGSASRASVFPAPFRPISGASTYADSAKDAVLPVLYGKWDLTKDLAIGLSINVPFGMVTEYAMDYMGRYHALKSDLKTMDVSPTLAYRVNDQWSFGVALIARKAEAILTNAIDFGTIGASAGSVPGTLDGQGRIEGSNWGYGYKVGVIYQPTPTLRFGFAHHGAMDITLKGNARFTFAANTPAPLTAAFQARGFKDGSAEAEMNLPAMTSLGMHFEVTPTVAVQAEVARTTWSRFKELRVKFATGLSDSVTVENWKDATFASVGAAWKLDSRWTLRAGVAFDQSAVDDVHRTPRIPEQDRLWYSAGASWQVTKAWAVDAAITHIQVKDSTLALRAGTSPTNPDFLRGDLNATYKNQIQILALQTRVTF